MLIELKSRWKLKHDLPDTLKELCEYWRCFTDIAGKMAVPGRDNFSGEIRQCTPGELP